MEPKTQCFSTQRIFSQQATPQSLKVKSPKRDTFFVFLLLILSMSSGLANYPDVNWSADRVVSGKRYFRAQRST